MPEPPVLEVSGLSSGYGRTTVLREIDLCVEPGQVVALIGPNGAGKTTLLRTISGYLSPTEGAIRIDGVKAPAKPHARARRGLTLVPEGRGVFPNLTVRENLRLQTPPWSDGRSFDAALEAFPVLRSRLSQRAGTMSGGEQQMLALSVCFLAEPRIVLLDEVSMGLAPKVVDDIFEALERLRAMGVALLLVEQYVAKALAIADLVLMLDRGRVTRSGEPKDFDQAAIAEHYLGGTV